MRAFLFSLVALVIITVGANQILTMLDFSSDRVTVSSDNVRIDP